MELTKQQISKLVDDKMQNYVSKEEHYEEIERLEGMLAICLNILSPEEEPLSLMYPAAQTTTT